MGNQIIIEVPEADLPLKIIEKGNFMIIESVSLNFLNDQIIMIK